MLYVGLIYHWENSEVMQCYDVTASTLYDWVSWWFCCSNPRRRITSNIHPLLWPCTRFGLLWWTEAMQNYEKFNGYTIRKSIINLIKKSLHCDAVLQEISQTKALHMTTPINQTSPFLKYMRCTSYATVNHHDLQIDFTSFTCTIYISIFKRTL